MSDSLNSMGHSLMIPRPPSLLRFSISKKEQNRVVGEKEWSRRSREENHGLVGGGGGGPASLAQSPGVSHGLDLEGLRSL